MKWSKICSVPWKVSQDFLTCQTMLLLCFTMCGSVHIWTGKAFTFYLVTQKSTPVLSSINAQENMNFQNKTVLNYQWVNLSLDILVKILSCHLSKIWMFKVRQVFWKLSKMRRNGLSMWVRNPGMINTTPDDRRSLRQLITEKFSWNQGSKFSFENKLIRAFYTHHKLYNFYQNWLTAKMSNQKIVTLIGQHNGHIQKFKDKDYKFILFYPNFYKKCGPVFSINLSHIWHK